MPTRPTTFRRTVRNQEEILDPFGLERHQKHLQIYVNKTTLITLAEMMFVLKIRDFILHVANGCLSYS